MTAIITSTCMKDTTGKVLDFVAYKAKREMEEHRNQMVEALLELGLPADNPEFWWDWEDEYPD